MTASRSASHPTASRSSRRRHAYISVMGTMGVGKSTAASLIASRFRYALIAENYGDNLFLPRFYRDMKRWAFHSQTFFLMEKISQTMETRQMLRTGPVVQDTPIEQDAFSYAQAHHIMGNIDDAEWMLYEKIYRTFSPQFPRPDLIVYLTARIDTITARIRSRGRGYEQEIPVEYLTLLDRLNREIIPTLTVPVVTIRTDSLDIVTNDRDRCRFLETVGTHLASPDVPATFDGTASTILSP